MKTKDRPENEYEILLERLVEVSADLGAEEVRMEALQRDYEALQEDNENLEKEAQYYKSLHNDEAKKRATAEKRFLSIHQNFMKYQSEQEKPVTKKIIESFLIILLKEGVVDLKNKQTWLAIIKMYRHLTGEKLKVSRDIIDDIRKNIENIEIVEEPIDIEEIKTNVVDIKRNESKIPTDPTNVKPKYPLARVQDFPRITTKPLSKEQMEKIYKGLGDGKALNDTMRSQK